MTLISFEACLGFRSSSLAFYSCVDMFYGFVVFISLSFSAMPFYLYFSLLVDVKV